MLASAGLRRFAIHFHKAVLSKGQGCLMDILCNRCRSPILDTDANLANRLARCRACNAVFDFTTQLQASCAAPDPSIPPVLKGVQIMEDTRTAPGQRDYRGAPREQRLVIALSWYSPRLWFLLIFCIAWDGLLIGLYASMFLNTIHSIPLLLIPTVHLAIGIGLTYYTISGFVNKSWITVTPDSITVRHAPLPWPGNRVIMSAELAQLYSEETVDRGRKGSRITYNLSAMLKDGRKTSLLSGLPSPREALFVEQQIKNIVKSDILIG